MNILFITLVEINSIEDRGIYQDLLRKFKNEGHKLTVITPVERRKKEQTNFSTLDGVSYLKVKALNITKTNVLEKGLATLTIEKLFLRAVKKYLKQTVFDIVLYSTPPITFSKVVEFVKKRDNAYTYLLLKDIFPQNALDMEMIKENGFLHKYFLRKEKKLYQISDTIGCMSPANMNYILKNNPQLDTNKVEVNPNSIEPLVLDFTNEEKISIRKKYRIPTDKTIFIYGGNLGKPQGLDFFQETIMETKEENVFFLIVGDGTEFTRLNNWFQNKKPINAKLIQRLPKKDYDTLLAGCDVGLIFLDRRFLIPNFPSRLLSYLEMKLPVLVATDSNTDIGDIVENNGCGFKIIAGNQKEMQNKIEALLNSDLKTMGIKSYNLLMQEYTVKKSYELIINKVKHV